MSMTLIEITSRASRLLQKYNVGEEITPNELVVIANDAYRVVAQLSGGLITTITQAATVGAGTATLSDPVGQSLNKVKYVTQNGTFLVEVPEILLLGGITSFPYQVYAWNFSSTTKKIYWSGLTSTANLTAVCQWLPKGNILLTDSSATLLSSELDDALVLYMTFKVLSNSLPRIPREQVQAVQTALQMVIQDMQKFDFFRGWSFIANQTSNP